MKDIQIYTALPPEAMEIRQRVFVEEQGLTDGEGEDDRRALHFVMHEDGVPVATCRVLKTAAAGEYLIGRIAVEKSARARGLGKELLTFAEEHIRSLGGKETVIRAQCAAAPFYQKCGYAPEGEVEYAEGRAHIYMRKDILR